MKVKYSPSFFIIQKKVNVRIRKRLKERLAIFIKNPNDLQLNNHELRDQYEGCRSIDVTVDYRAVYKEIQEDEEKVVYFVTLGTHDELYKSVSPDSIGVRIISVLPQAYIFKVI